MSDDAKSAQARRAAITSQIQAETGIDEAMIERLVREFYVRVRDDAVLGPIFAAKIGDWEPHLQRMFAFWSSVALMSGRYHGQPIAKHLPLPIDARHFDRWLALFAETAREVCPPAAAERFTLLSRRVGESLVAAVSIWTPLADPDIAHRWFSWPNLIFLAPLPVVTAVIAFSVWRSLNGQSEAGPFIGAIGLFLMSYLGIAISLWPMIVPHHYTLREAASSQSTQAFLLVGTLFLLPIILLYTAWSYWVFRGKVRADIGYH